VSVSDTSSESGLRVEGLRYASQGFVLGPVDFALRPGELLAVFGPNGAGKSTLLRLLAGFDSGAVGRIRLDGREISALPSHRREIGMVFQDLALFPQLTVWENIGYGPRAHRWPESQVSARVEELLQEFRLGPLAGRTPPTLSGGEQQRVALARALASRPRVLLFDEPLSSADREIRGALQSDIRERVTKDRLVAVYVTHDLEEGMALADRLAFLNDGRWVAEGPAEDIRRAPPTRMVAESLGFNVWRAEGRWLAANPTRTQILPAGTPDSMPGEVQEVRRNGELVYVDVSTPPDESGERMRLRAVLWAPSAPARVGDRVGVRFTEKILLDSD
jgi:ABC-type Fe3+/spermidine/putrescine transport system ATPase subunit